MTLGGSFALLALAAALLALAASTAAYIRSRRWEGREREAAHFAQVATRAGIQVGSPPQVQGRADA